jgi:hypothetical protein
MAPRRAPASRRRRRLGFGWGRTESGCRRRLRLLEPHQQLHHHRVVCHRRLLLNSISTRLCLFQMGFSIKLRKKVLSLWLDHPAVCRSHSGTRRSDSNSGHGSDRRRRRKRHSAIVETRSVVRFGVRTNRRGSERLSHRFEEHENHERR